MKNHKGQKRMNGILHKFRRNRDGIAAVEFALIVPLLLAMYLGTVELSTGITVNKRVARVASTVADLVTQQPSEVDTATLKSILGIGAAIMYPYTADQPIITVVGVDVDTSYPTGGKVVWSRQYNKGTYNRPFTSNSNIEVPTRLRIDGTFVVKVTTDIEYRPIVTWVIGSKTDVHGNSYTALDISEEYWLRPRISDRITCKDC